MLRATGKQRLFVDADGATPIEELGRLQTALLRGADIAIASRAISGDGAVVRGTVHRKVMGTIFNILVKVFAVSGVKDTQCGFKLFTAESTERIFASLTIDDFGFDVEVLYLARKFGYKVSEIPVSWTDVNGSKVKLFADSIKMFTDIFKIRFNDISGRYDRA
ncbi:hypothetical protein GMSM_04070 [Geomonas sp. Red276]